MLEIELRGKAVQRKSLDQLHHNRRRIGFIEHGENGDDGRVAEGGGVARLVEHATAHRLIGAAAQNFDGHAPVKLLVMRRINHPQAAFAQLAFDTKAGRTGQRFFAVQPGGFHASPQLPHPQAGLDALAGFPPQCFRQGCQIRFQPRAGLFVRIAQKSLGTCRRVKRGRAPGPGGGRGRRRHRLSPGARAEKIARLVMGVQQRLDFLPEGRVVGALLSHKIIAPIARRQFNRPGEHGFGVDRRWIHCPRNLAGL